ncbi:Fe-S cluster assembly protein SufD [Acetobacter oeni]|uniref:Fe-S cluster assembly protein SufD n=1 Tax=Acetobacter oeni TaxID=304077 RepID=A0A511XJN3_9PROT|nr:Fe-S cluster assembly protein SufD [Acetobacter oeni]MBB3883374.1 Fe-S cluster assembly protein SufD [Acetobacter oeni]NHO19458.1 Fe-S cluster assembly protein SufD [Acetobacter oeni]GBR00692.1 iron-sulfur assembly protein SufD [Acetobacter oeni LMG 21952]GEN63157.1 Fe-S cluster assembly protein SufD [Acetobacter oeni]
MNAITPSDRGLAPFEARLSSFQDATRKAAAGDLALTGLPGPRVEAWHYTSLRALNSYIFNEPDTCFNESAVQVILRSLIPQSGCLEPLPRLVLVNGRVVPALSSPAASLPEGVTFSAFSGSPDFGMQASPQRDPLVALNTALAVDGIKLVVEPRVKAGRILLISLAMSSSGAISFHPRHSVTLGEGASLTLIEIAAGSEGPGAYFHNPVLSCSVAEGAHLEHIKLQREAADAIHLATVYADIASHATYESFTLGLGAVLARHEVHATLRGSHAGVHVNGAQLLGSGQVGDITSVITHGAPDCISRQTVRNVLTDRARAVFQGKVLVERVAQKTDGYQMNQALLLSPTAGIDAKPELEIYADDVKCSHGATVGALDEEQLFYLRSRGIPDAGARQMLVEAFLTEAADLVQDEVAHAALGTALTEALVSRIAAWENAS